MRLAAKLALGLVVLLIALPVAGLLGNRPPLTDPPGFAARIRGYFTTNVVETREDSAFPELRPRTFPVPARRLYEAVRGAAEALGWEPVSGDPQRLAVRAVVTTPLLRFRDDVLATVHGNGEDSATLYVRSASRVGRGDLGANTRHVLDLYGAVAARLDGPGRTR